MAKWEWGMVDGAVGHGVGGMGLGELEMGRGNNFDWPIKIKMYNNNSNNNDNNDKCSVFFGKQRTYHNYMTGNERVSIGGNICNLLR